jgi:rod shape-determining protein MreD
MFGIISIYIIGMLEDIVSSTPFGINIFTILFVYVLTNLIYKFVANKPFTVTWYGFAFIAASASIIKWFVLSIYYSQFLPFIPLIFSLLATIVFYPIFSFVNAYIQNHLMEDDI